MILNKDEVIGRKNTPHRARIAEYLARDLLLSRGYTVLRSIDADFLVNLVAWTPAGGPVMIRVTSTRRELSGAAQAATLWNDEIRALRALPLPAGGSVQIWISTDRKGWHIYQVLVCGRVCLDRRRWRPDESFSTSAVLQQSHGRC